MAAKRTMKINHEGWMQNAVAFLREKGLEQEFYDWCGGWKYPAAPTLLEACKEFVRKVECGEARSKRSYQQMKAAIALAEGQ